MRRNSDKGGKIAVSRLSFTSREAVFEQAAAASVPGGCSEPPMRAAGGSRQRVAHGSGPSHTPPCETGAALPGIYLQVSYYIHTVRYVCSQLVHYCNLVS